MNTNKLIITATLIGGLYYIVQLKKKRDNATNKIKNALDAGKNNFKTTQEKQEDVILPTGTDINKEYRFLENKDVVGNDIKHYSTFKNMPEKLRQMCNFDAKCMGFNTDGVLKSKIPEDEKELATWRAENDDLQHGLYVNIKRNPIKGSDGIN